MRFLLSIFLLSAATFAQAKPRLIVPIDLNAPDPVPVRITGLPPRAVVAVETFRRGYDGKDVYEASARFDTDARGQVDLGKVPPLEGSYTGINPLGIFWSGKARPAILSDVIAGRVEINARIDGKIVASAVAMSDPDPATFTMRRDTPFPGAVWAVPKTKGPHPIVIVLGGSEGGSSVAREMAPIFAARGYATLGLPYYDPGYDPNDRVPGLPKNFIEIPVDRLAEVKRWLGGQRDADAKRIGIWGASKGAEFALIAASRYNWIKAVVAVVPTDLVWEGWGVSGPSRSSFSFGGTPLPFQPYAGMDAEFAKAAKGEAMDIGKVHREGRIKYPERIAAARIPIEQFRGRLLVIGGGQDAVWPSGEMAANIVKVRAAAGLATDAVIVADAGHSLGGPGTEPVAPFLANGGEAVAVAKGRAEGWRKTFRLFDRAFRR